MNDLIAALQIFAKYGNPDNPTHCEHDEMNVAVDSSKVSDQDKAELEKLGFFESGGFFKSFRFGSC